MFTQHSTLKPDLDCKYGDKVTNKVKGTKYRTVVNKAVVKRGIWAPCRKATFPSCSHLREGVPFRSARVMGETTVITNRKSFAYDSKNKVAKTGTTLDPVNLAILVEYLLPTIIAPTRIQTYTGNTNCSQAFMLAFSGVARS